MVLIGVTERVSNWSPKQLIADLFLNEGNFLVIYSQYVNNYERALDTIKAEIEVNKEFAAFLEVHCVHHL